MIDAGTAPVLLRPARVGKAGPPATASTALIAFEGPEVATLVTLRSLLSWPAGWDGGEALAPEPAAVRKAARIITAFARVVVANEGRFVLPNVTASVDGEVVFEWWHDLRKLTLYVGNSGVGYVQVWGPNVETEMVSDDLRDAQKLPDLWRWLTSR